LGSVEFDQFIYEALEVALQQPLEGKVSPNSVVYDNGVFIPVGANLLGTGAAADHCCSGLGAGGLLFGTLAFIQSGAK
jgi:hypothetical protein